MGSAGSSNYAPLRVKKKPNIGDGMEGLDDEEME